jgi:hypothetical protein
MVASWSDTAIVAVVPAGASSGSFSVTVNSQVVTSPSFTVTAFPSGWSDTDVGPVSQAGSATYSNGTFTVTGGGGNIGGSVDAMHFVYQTLVGDGSIIAQLTGSPYSAEAVVMMRETLDPSSTNAFVYYYPNQAFLQYRPTTGASVVYQATGYDQSPNFPYWFQLARVGNTFTGYVSPDGVNWTQIGTSTTITMAQSVYIGLAVSGGTDTFGNVSVNSTATPSPVITGLSPTTASVGSQVSIGGNNFGGTQGGSVLLLNGTPVPVSTWSNLAIVFTVPAGATSGPLVVSVAPIMNNSNPVNLEVTAQPLPTSWLNQDVGAEGGSTTFSGGTFTVTGAGNGLGGTADGMQFAYQTLVGDGSIIARLTGLQNTPNSGTDAGVMIRETLNPGAADATVFYSGGSGYLYFQDRATTGATANTVQGSYIGAAFPEWLEVVRSGNTFTAFTSPNGVSWTQIGTSTTVTMAQTVYIGLAVSGFGTLDPLPSTTCRSIRPRIQHL